MIEDETRWLAPEESGPSLFAVDDLVDARYRVRSHLGRGGMGEVLGVEDVETGESLALKYCQPGQDSRRFAREVRIMQAVSSRHVIPIVGANLDHDPPYFVMPLADRSLEGDIPRLVGNEAAVLAVFEQICLGVSDLHAREVFHRDLKPANILRLADGRMVVCDLGLARTARRDTTVLTRTVGLLGTEGYLAPEQRLPDGSRNSDARTDVYQLGKVLYQLLTGRHPRFLDLAGLSGGLAYILRKATADHPDDRYPSVDRFQAALVAYLASKDPLKSPREVLEHLISRLERDHPESVPPGQELAGVLETLGHGGALEPHLQIDCLHRVPVSWWLAIASEHEPSLHPCLSAYCAAIQEKIEAYPWSFADLVSARMTAIFEHSAVDRTKVLALRSLMTAADRLGRFAAQRAFCNCLEGIKTIELALPIADMISDHARPELLGFAGFNLDLYHPAIQASILGLRPAPRDPGPPHP